MYCEPATSREKCCLNNIQWICYSADLYGCCLKKINKNSPSLPTIQIGLFTRNGTICPCHCKQPAAQPTLTVHLGHSTSYNEGLPVSVYSLSMLSVPAIDTKDSEEMSLFLTHLSILHALLPTAPLTRSQSRSGFFFHILTAAAFFCPPLLCSISTAHVSSLIYLCKLNGRCCWCIQLGMDRKSLPQPNSADIVHEACPWSRHPQTVSGLKYLPLSDAVNLWL